MREKALGNNISVIQNYFAFLFQISLVQLILYDFKFPVKMQMVHILLLMLVTCSLSLRSDILLPEEIEHLMFTEEITGIPQLAIPDRIAYSDGYTLAARRFTISMKKIKQKILPGKLPSTEIYAYGAQTKKGMKFSFPGPFLINYHGVDTEIVWRNQIYGKHILPVDFNEPFINSSLFRNEVPTVPHAHGLTTRASSDGGPNNYWTATGRKSDRYTTQGPVQKNQALYIYTNEQGPGLFWYHDHTLGITRLNVYAGLAGFYEVISRAPTLEEKKIRDFFNHGQQIQKRFFTISDRSFKKNGDLYYPEQAQSKDFTAWIPQFFGNMITVNGKVWPQVTLEQKVYRLIFLNANQARYINLYFQSRGKKLPFRLIRADASYYATTVETKEYLLSPAARIEIIIDLTNVDGDVMVRNSDPTPPTNGHIEILTNKFTSYIMKINMKYGKYYSEPDYFTYSATFYRQSLQEYLKDLSDYDYNYKDDYRYDYDYKNLYEETSPYYYESKADKQIKLSYDPYPAFEQGEKVWVTLSENMDQDGNPSGVFLNGIGMEVSQRCQGQTFRIGKVYDFYIINLTVDIHPIHFHLINMQKIKQFPFNAKKYQADWEKVNGKTPKRGYRKFPKMLDPERYQQGRDIYPKPHQKVFKDVIDANPDLVTVVRISFTLKNGRPFTFDASGSMFVWHCHILEHEDNQMMTNFCLK